MLVSRLCVCLSVSIIANLVAVSLEAADDSFPLHGRITAFLRQSKGNFDVAYIQSPQRIQCFSGGGDNWKPSVIELTTPSLVPGGALALLPIEGVEFPQLLTIAADGRFLRMTGRQSGTEVIPVDDKTIPAEFRFPAGGRFQIAKFRKRDCLFAVDNDGRLWEFVPGSGQPTLIEGRPELLLPGSAIGLMADEGDELFLIDRRGNLVSYIRDPVSNWKGPRLIGANFMAGAEVTVWRRPDNRSELQLAAVDLHGEALVGRLDPTGWKLQIVPGWVQSAGSSLGVAHTPINIRLSDVTGTGVARLMHLINTEWREFKLGEGFPWKSNTFMSPHGPIALGVDISGSLITSLYKDEAWFPHITPTDSTGKTVRLLKRRWKREPGGSQFELLLTNTASEELLVRIRNRLDPAQLIELKIAPAMSNTVALISDTAGELIDSREQTFGDNKFEATVRTTVPAQALYDVEVLAMRDTIPPYLDLRQTPWPAMSSHTKTPSCLGQFVVPVSMPTGTKVDLFRSAADRQLTTVAP